MFGTVMKSIKKNIYPAFSPDSDSYSSEIHSSSSEENNSMQKSSPTP